MCGVPNVNNSALSLLIVWEDSWMKVSCAVHMQAGWSELHVRASHMHFSYHANYSVTMYFHLQSCIQTQIWLSSNSQ